MTGLLRIYARIFFLLAVALSSVTHAQARHAAHGAQTVVICTGDGLLRITLDADGNPVEHSQPCPDCVPGSAVVLAGAGAVLPVPLSASMARPAARAALVAGACAGGWHDSRAPPALV